MFQGTTVIGTIGGHQRPVLRDRRAYEALLGCPGSAFELWVNSFGTLDMGGVASINWVPLLLQIECPCCGYPHNKGPAISCLYSGPWVLEISPQYDLGMFNRSDSHRCFATDFPATACFGARGGHGQQNLRLRVRWDAFHGTVRPLLVAVFPGKVVHLDIGGDLSWTR